MLVSHHTNKEIRLSMSAMRFVSAQNLLGTVVITVSLSVQV